LLAPFHARLRPFRAEHIVDAHESGTPPIFCGAMRPTKRGHRGDPDFLADRTNAVHDLAGDRTHIVEWLDLIKLYAGEKMSRAC